MLISYTRSLDISAINTERPESHEVFEMFPFVFIRIGNGHTLRHGPWSRMDVSNRLYQYRVQLLMDTALLKSRDGTLIQRVVYREFQISHNQR